MSIVAIPFSVACLVDQVVDRLPLVILCTFPFNLHEVGCIFVPVFHPPPHEEQIAKHERKKSVFSRCGTVQILLVSFKSASRHARKGMINVWAFYHIFLHCKDSFLATTSYMNKIFSIVFKQTYERILF